MCVGVRDGSWVSTNVGNIVFTVAVSGKNVGASDGVPVAPCVCRHSNL